MTDTDPTPPPAPGQEEAEGPDGIRDRSVREVVERTRDVIRKTRELLDSSRDLLDRVRQRDADGAEEPPAPAPPDDAARPAESA